MQQTVETPFVTKNAVFADAKGRIFVERLTADVPFVRTEGVMSNVIAKQACAYLATKPFSVIYIDAWNLVSFENKCRAIWVECLLQQKAIVHVTQQSKIVAMGLAMAQLALQGRIQQHSHFKFTQLLQALAPEPLSAPRAGGAR